MRILITAGGTTEKIDEVRSITSTSTGLLGKTIADSFCAFEETETVYFLCGLTSVVPLSRKVTIIRIGSVTELQEEITNILSREKIDAVIHSMAVSDKHLLPTKGVFFASIQR
jgi:Phosphopantothenoylcysteine synthetase/decarboxylase